MAAAMIAATTQSQALWYLTRSTGLVALVLLTASVVLGVTQVTRWTSPRVPRFVTATLHKNISLLVVVFVGIHVVTAVADSYAPIGLLDAVIPFRSPYRPLWLGLGAVAFDLLLALIVTSLLRVRIGHAPWRAVHWIAYACWPVAFLHGLGTGSDTRVSWSLYVSLAMLALVVGAVVWRLVAVEGVASGTRAWFAVGGAALVAAMLAWLVSGPLQPGWAQRAGTPASLLGGHARNAAALVPSSLPGPFSATFTGTIRQSVVSSNRATVTIDGNLSGHHGHLHVELTGAPLDTGGIALEQSVATFGPSNRPGLFTGAIDGLDGSVMRARVRDTSGHRMLLSISLNVDASSNALTGTVSARNGSD